MIYVKVKIVGLEEAIFTYLYYFLCVLIGFVRLMSGCQYEEQEVNVQIFGA